MLNMRILPLDSRPFTFENLPLGFFVSSNNDEKFFNKTGDKSYQTLNGLGTGFGAFQIGSTAFSGDLYPVKIDSLNVRRLR